MGAKGGREGVRKNKFLNYSGENKPLLKAADILILVDVLRVYLSQIKLSSNSLYLSHKNIYCISVYLSVCISKWHIAWKVKC